MQHKKIYWAIGGVMIIITATAFGAAYRAKAPTVDNVSMSPVSTTTDTTRSTATTTPAVLSFPINPADMLANWHFTGAYSSSDSAMTEAQNDITHLTNLLGTGEYDDYDLYNGIANDYGLLGDGRTAYQFYNRAIRIHPKKGLAYANLGHLMDELGARYTAADAYAAATHAEPGMLEYHTERLTYLARQFPNDTARITAALTDASNVFGDTAQILSIEAQWLTRLHRYADALAAWEKVKQLSPGQDTTAIDAEIARLKALQ
ncbi:hypothetical protein KGQ72_02190 [Patescibacteria group bacterium]|nr:hypothetical protein [Patescibacteria group bacterium]